MLNLPNSITLSRIALVVVFTIAVSVAHQCSCGYPVALASFVLAAFSDWLDGYLARKLEQVTTFGKLIDPLADKIAVAAAFIYLTSIGLCPTWATIVIISREFLVTGIRQIAQDQGVVMAADMTGKCKTVFQLAFCTGGLLVMTVSHWQGEVPVWLYTLSDWCDPRYDHCYLYFVTFWGSVILTVWSGLSYCIGARHLLFRK